MATTLNNDDFLRILREHDWERTSLLLTRYADKCLRSRLVQGAPIARGPNDLLALPDGRTAEDLAADAVEALLSPNTTGDRRGRTWDPEKTPQLLDFLTSTIKSMISNALTNRKNLSTEGQAQKTKDNGTEKDFVLDAEDPHGIPQETNSRKTEYQQQIEKFRDTLRKHPDTKLLELFECYENGYTKPRDIETLVDISTARISELKRKLRTHLDKFFISKEIQEEIKKDAYR